MNHDKHIYKYCYVPFDCFFSDFKVVTRASGARYPKNNCPLNDRREENFHEEKCLKYV